MWDKLPKEIFPTQSDIRKNPEFYKKKRIVTRSYGGQKTRYYDQDIMTGICYMCKRNHRAQNTYETQLHHLSYMDYNENPILWTIELCPKCHTRVDEHRKARITQYYNRKRDERYQQYIKNREQYYGKPYSLE